MGGIMPEKQIFEYKYENEEFRKEILKKAHEYLNHEDPWIRILAQIALYHYGD